MIKNFTIGKIYQDIDNLYDNISKLDFKDNVFGEEIDQFQLLSPEMKQILNSFSPALEVSEDSGLFRKPYNLIHCENVPQMLIFVGFLAITNTKITFYKHLETNSEGAFEINVPVDDVLSDLIYEDKWEEFNEINLKAGELYFFHPSLWHKIDSELVQVFYMYIKEEKKEQHDNFPVFYSQK